MYRPKYSWCKRKPNCRALPGASARGFFSTSNAAAGPAIRPAIMASRRPTSEPSGRSLPNPKIRAFSWSEIDTFNMATRMIAPTQIDKIV